MIKNIFRGQVKPGLGDAGIRASKAIHPWEDRETTERDMPCKSSGNPCYHSGCTLYCVATCVAISYRESRHTYRGVMVENLLRCCVCISVGFQRSTKVFVVCKTAQVSFWEILFTLIPGALQGLARHLLCICSDTIGLPSRSFMPRPLCMRMGICPNDARTCVLRTHLFVITRPYAQTCTDPALTTTEQEKAPYRAAQGA
jgi:hypothetical protein